MKVRLSEMRGGGDMTPAHETDRLAEMVCSNSFRSDDAENNAVGLLHQEMRALGLAGHALRRRAPRARRLGAGGRPRGVRRRGHAARSTAIPNIDVVRERVDALPDHPTIIATGPLTGSALAEAIAARDRQRRARLLRRDRADRPPRQHRHGRRAGWPRAGTRAARITSTARWTRSSIDAFVQALLDGEKTEFKEWEKDTPYFEGCMPIEVMAERGLETLALRADEAGRARRSAHRPLALCGGPAAPGQCARHLVEHGRLPDQAEAWRAGAACSAPSRAWRMPSSRGSAASTATASSIRRGCSTASCG